MGEVNNNGRPENSGYGGHFIKRQGRPAGRSRSQQIFDHRLAIARSLSKFERQKAALQRAVEFEVVPRLLSAHPPLASPICDCSQPAARAKPARSKTEFCRARPCQKPGRGLAACSGLLERGHRSKTIYLKLLAPTARLSQTIMDRRRPRLRARSHSAYGACNNCCANSARRSGKRRKSRPGLRALLTLAPGETHELPYLLFTLVLTGEFFRREGWSSWIEPDCARGDTLALVRNEWFDVIGISGQWRKAARPSGGSDQDDPRRIDQPVVGLASAGNTVSSTSRVGKISGCRRTGSRP